jgi:2-(3-amino-3-carboxypropyl)histidine synthase
MYNFEHRRVTRFLKKHKARRAALQLPAGFRPYLSEIIATFEGVGTEAIILGDSCYGACDVADVKAKRLGCDALVQYGHSDIGLWTVLPTFYVEARATVEPLMAVEKSLPKLNFKRVGLATTVQHIESLPKIAKILRSSGIKSIVGKPGSRARYQGQILGCDWSSVKSISGDVDGFLYIGTGKFHPVGISLATGKRVIMLNPLAGGCENLTFSLEDFLRRRKAMISRAAAGEKFGVLVSSKPGQARLKLASRLAGEFRRAGLTAHILILDEISQEKLDDFKLDAFVCVACPRIPIDDAERFSKPILTPFEARVMIGKAQFEPYKLDEVKPSDF